CTQLDKESHRRVSPLRFALNEVRRGGLLSRTVTGGIPVSSPQGWVHGVSWKAAPHAGPAPKLPDLKYASSLTRKRNPASQALSMQASRLRSRPQYPTLAPK